MHSAKLTDVKNNLSRYIEQVRKGRRVRILVRGVPVADLVPAEQDVGSGDDARLSELERRNILRRGRTSVPDAILTPGPRPRGASLSAYILEEREAGR